MPAVTLDPSYLLGVIGTPAPRSALQALAPLCDLFMREMEVRLDALQDAFDKQVTVEPGEEVDFLLHAFRGSASNYGALRLVELALEGERTPREWHDIARVTAELRFELANVRRALDELVRPATKPPQSHSERRI